MRAHRSPCQLPCARRQTPASRNSFRYSTGRSAKDLVHEFSTTCVTNDLRQLHSLYVRTFVHNGRLAATYLDKKDGNFAMAGGCSIFVLGSVIFPPLLITVFPLTLSGGFYVYNTLKYRKYLENMKIIQGEILEKEKELKHDPNKSILNLTLEEIGYIHSDNINNYL